MTTGRSPQIHAIEPVGTLPASGDAERLLAEMPDVVSRVSLDGMFLYTSPASETLLGRRPDELIGTSAFRLFDDLDRREAEAKVVGLVAGETATEHLTGRVRRPDGSYVWIDANARIAVDPDTGERTIVVVTRPGAESIEAERALARLEERFRELVEWIPAVVYEADPGREGRFHYVSPQIKQLLGYEPEEWLADPELWAASLHPEDRDWVVALETQQEQLTSSGGMRMGGGEYRMIHRDGRVVQVRDVARLAGPEGRQYWRGVLVDVTGARAAEMTLSEAHDSYRQMVDGLPACVYRCEPGNTGDWTYISPQIERLLGYTPAEIMSDPEIWEGCIHPDDRDRVARDEDELTKMPPGSQYVNEFRMQTRDGRSIWVRDRAVLAIEADGGLIMDGLLIDISAERRAPPSNTATADLFRLNCADCAHAWAAERLGPCPECGGINVDGVSLNATLGELAESRRQVEGLLDGIHRHLEALGTNLRSVSDQLPFGGSEEAAPKPPAT